MQRSTAFHPTSTRLAALALTVLIPACSPDGGAERDRDMRRGDDRIATGREVNLADSVPGDVIAAAGEIRFTGVAGGDYLGAGGEQRIAGRVQGSVRAAGGNIVVSGQVGRGMTVAGGSIVLAREAVAEKNVYMAGGSMRVSGTVRGELSASGGSVFIDGPIGGSVAVSARELRLGPNAVITGDLRHRVPPGEVRIDPEARIGGEVVALPVRDWRTTWLLIRVLLAIGFLVAGAAAIALFPGTFAGATIALRERTGLAAVAGIAMLIVVPVAAVLIALTIIGLPLGLITLGAWMILAYLSRAVVALWIGRRLLSAQAEGGRAALVAAFLAGAVILLVLGAIPVIGSLVTLVASLLGLGALVLGHRVRSRTIVE